MEFNHLTMDDNQWQKFFKSIKDLNIAPLFADECFDSYDYKKYKSTNK